LNLNAATVTHLELTTTSHSRLCISAGFKLSYPPSLFCTITTTTVEEEDAEAGPFTGGRAGALRRGEKAE